MVAAKYGKSDPDIHKGSKETRDGKLAAVGSDPFKSAMIGGVSNTTENPSMKKKGSMMKFAKGGKVISTRSC